MAQHSESRRGKDDKGQCYPFVLSTRLADPTNSLISNQIAKQGHGLYDVALISPIEAEDFMEHARRTR